MERVFLIIGHRVRTDAKFNLNDLCGSTGRLDILLRTINSAFLLSNGIRKDVTLYLVLKGEPDPPVTICLRGKELKYLNPDERSTGALIRQALLAKRETGEWVPSTPGISVSNQDYPQIIEELKKDGRVPVYLHETGERAQDLLFGYHMKMGKDRGKEMEGKSDRHRVEEGEKEKEKEEFFILGDQFDLTEEEEECLGKEAKKISLGPNILHTDHCVILIHNILDRIEHGS